MTVEDIQFMRQALREARRGLGWTAPNPAVGAVIVRDGHVLAKGFHHFAGGPHAEVEALRALEGPAAGATLYVTLEPCNHQGRTPPCTEAILAAGVGRVVVGMEDPNPHVRGGGCEYLRSRGVRVETGVLEKECRRLNEGFVKYSRTGRPFVVTKSALTLDGWTATARGDARWVSNARSRAYVHRLRHETDAVMVGIGTVLADDPALTTRPARGKGKDPLRVVVDTHLRTPLTAKIVTQVSPAATLLAAASSVPALRYPPYEQKGVRVLACPPGEEGVDLEALLKALGELGVASVLVEGGATLMGSLWRARLVDKCLFFLTPKLLGGNDGIPFARGRGPALMSGCTVLEDVGYRRLDDDILLSGYPRWPEPAEG